MESQRCFLKASFQIGYHQIWPSWLYYIWPLKCAAVNIWQPPQTENICVREGGSPEQVLVISSHPFNNVFVFVFVYLCKKKWECATRLSSSGLPSLGDPCRPRWERGPCRSRGAGGAGSVAQPTKQVAPEGKERTKRNIWVDELLKSRLELGICYCQRFEPGWKATSVLSSISPGGQRNTGGKIILFLILLISFFCSDSDRHNAMLESL